MQVVSQDNMRACVYKGASIVRDRVGFKIVVFGEGGNDLNMGYFGDIEAARAVINEIILSEGTKDVYRVPEDWRG